MIKIVIIFLTLLLCGCSLKNSQKDVWIKNSSNSFESYSRYFLKGENRLALVSLKRAVQSAKSSANLKPLARIYLGVCALNRAVLISDNCEGYLSIKDLLGGDEETISYYNMLQKNLDSVDAKYIPEQYRSFIKSLKKGDYKSAIKTLRGMDDIRSMLICASLIKDSLKKEDIEFIVDRLSYYGYKKALVSWLRELKTESSLAQSRKIDKILNILK